MSTYNKLLLTVASLLTFIIYGCTTQSGSKTIWQIGLADGKAAEFALAPYAYQDFLKHDFGWEDRFFLINKHDQKSDWPYILPGPNDEWGGTGGTSGIRTHVLNILFGLDQVKSDSAWKLKIALLDVSNESGCVLKVTVNGKSWKKQFDAGSGDIFLEQKHDTSSNQYFCIDIDPQLIRQGGNQIQLTILEGSWIIFDYIALQGPQSSKTTTAQKAFVRQVKAADYQLTDQDAQALLVDVDHLVGNPNIEVKLDGIAILKQQLEQGRYILEAPMPAVKDQTTSNYTVLVDGKEIQNGSVIRTQQAKATPASYVDTHLGTAHSRWMIAPGPWMPFGMVKLSPDNQDAGWQAGYQPSIESIGCFSHIHEWTMGGLGMMPTMGELCTLRGPQGSALSSQSIENKTYRSGMDKATEKTPLGYYSVMLTDYGIQAELTATTRCGFQKYTYPKTSTSAARVMIDLQIPTEYNYNIEAYEIKQIDKRRVEGFSKQQSPNAWSGGVNQDYVIYFVLEFDQDITKFGGWKGEQLLEHTTIAGKNAQATSIGAYAEFNTQNNNVVQCRSAISYVDIEGARKNLKMEITDPFDFNFEAIHQAQVDTWNQILNKISISSNDQREKMRFYTNMYRSYCRNIFSDVDGRWVDATEKIQKYSDPDAVALGCDAFWNTFWNLNQVWNLITPEWSSRWVKSQLGMYDANGWLAKGPAGMEYIPVMVAEHEIPLLVGAYQMGIRDYNTEKLFTAVHKMQTTLPTSIGNGFAGNEDLAAYLKYQYVPSDKGRFSNSLEYSFDDWTVGQLALAMGKTDAYKQFNDRGYWWRNVIEPKSGFAQLRLSDGSWEQNFDPFKSGANHHYVEGNAWQLTFFVPQDVPALAEAIGKEQFIERLTWGFEASEPWRYNAPGDQYWDFPVVQGNQQSMHFAFLFNWVGQAWQTQKWSRSILDRYYGFETANAYLGDEDQGQMSAWFVMAALGLFQTDGGTRHNPIYEIGSPIFEKTSIQLDEKYGRGKNFIIEAKGASRKNKYIQSAELNGKPLNSFQFPASELLKGGKLSLVMGDQANKQWGTEMMK